MSHKKPTQRIPSSGHSSKGESVFLDQWVSRAHTHMLELRGLCFAFILYKHIISRKTSLEPIQHSQTFSNILPCLRMFLNQDYCANFPFILVSLFISVWNETMLWFLSESPSFFYDKGTLPDLPPAYVDSTCAYQNMWVLTLYESLCFDFLQRP